MSSINPIPSGAFGPTGSPLANKLNSVGDATNSLRNIAFGPAFLTNRLANGLTVNINERFFEQLARSRKRLAKVSAWTLISGSDSRWRYTMKQVVLSSGSTDITAFAPTGDDEVEFTAFNLTEINNVTLGTGTQGNSVDDSEADFPAGFALQPVGGGSAGTPGNEVIVECTERTTADGVITYTFEYQNAVDGSCA